jgi:glycosyltransferase involved in cell wall biosynthesis
MSRPRLLYLVHAYDNLGGVELHTRALAEGLCDAFEIYVAFPQRGTLQLRHGTQTVAAYPAETPGWPMTQLRVPRTEQSVAELLRAVRPDLIHVQHLHGWPLGVLDQLTATGVPVIASFHDFYAITPYFTMQGADTPEETFTAAYCEQVFGRDITPYLAERRRWVEASLQRVRARITISPYLERLLQRIYPGDYRVIEYGIPPFQRDEVPARGGLHFGYVGGLYPQKGWRELFDAFPLVRARHPAAQLHFFGGHSFEPPSAAGVTFHGLYRPDDLPRLTAAFDVAVIPSLFPETYCLVLSEMWHAGLPVAVSDLGALGERVVDRANGRKFRPGNPESIAAALCWFLERDTWRRWHPPQPRLLPAMLADYDRLYRSVLRA